VSLPVIIVGAGGHAAAVADALLEANTHVLGFTDQDAKKHGTLRLDLPILGGDETLTQYAAVDVRLANGLGFISGSGRISLRARVQQQLQAQGWSFVTVVHPRAIISRSATLASGCQVLAAAVIQPGTTIGTGTIINTAAVVEHDALVGDWCHLASRSTLCGHTKVGAGSLIGAGAVLRQSITLGEDTIVGAGAVVLHNSPGGETLCGVPARSIGMKK
jgi:UDP-perosamine 4-acetyltransferase